MIRHITSVVALIFGLAMLAGCSDLGAANQQTASLDTPANKSATGAKHADEHDCDHAEKGPHGGEVFDLGGTYHAELVHDEGAHLIHIYLLDAQVREPVAIEEEQIVVNALVKGNPVKLELAGTPLTSDGEGRSSHFQSKDEALFHAMVDEPGSKSRLRVNIEGKQYVAEIAACEDHEHEGHHHEGHEHVGHHHEGHEHEVH